MDIIICYPHFQSINFGKSLSICQRLFVIFKWKDIIMLSVPASAFKIPTLTPAPFNRQCTLGECLLTCVQPRVQLCHHHTSTGVVGGEG